LAKHLVGATCDEQYLEQLDLDPLMCRSGQQRADALKEGRRGG
jgi:hypothetical protein